MVYFQEPKEEDKRTPLEKRNDVFVDRVKVGVNAGLIACVVSLVFLLIAYWLYPDLHHEIPFHQEFADWNSIQDRSKQMTVEELVSNAINGFFLTTITVVQLNSVTSVTRLVSIITIMFFVTINYRKFLREQLELDGRQAQLFDYDNSPKTWRYNISYASFVLATVLGSYAFASILLYCLALAFPSLRLNLFFALVVTGLITGVFTGLPVYWATAVDSRGILLLALSTLIAGLLLSFTLINRQTLITGEDYWWKVAVSAAGRYRPASPIFTASFMSVVFAMVSVWFDLDTLLPIFVKKVQADAERASTESSNKEAENVLIWLFESTTNKIREFWEKRNNKAFYKWDVDWLLRKIGFLYFLTGLCLWMVGLIPMNAPFPIDWLHGIGAWGSSLCIIFLTLIIPKTPYYQLIYRDFSVVYVFTLAMITPLYIVGFVSLTGMELLGLAFIIVWIFTTLDGLLFYMNNKWSELKTHAPPPVSEAAAAQTAPENAEVSTAA